MEHRHGIRRNVNIATSVELMTGSVISACIRDVSFGGVFVELPTEGLWSHAPIKLEFKIPQGNELVTHYWRGFVTRIANKGAGAMFESTDPEEQAGLLALLKLADRSGVPITIAC